MEVTSDSLDFWNTLEADFSIKLPNHFKNILTLTGFGNASTFALLTRDDVQKACDFVRNKLVKRFDLSDEHHRHLAIYFYGKYYSCEPHEFEFQAGELKLIDNLVEYVKQQIAENEGQQYFQQKKYSQDGRIQTPVGKFFGDCIQKKLQSMSIDPTQKPMLSESVAEAIHEKILNTTQLPTPKQQKTVNDVMPSSIQTNDDVLEKSAEFLRLMKVEFGELLNAADKSLTMKPAALSVFAKKHGHKYVFLRASSLQDSRFVIEKERISADTIQGRLKILRCFGEVITKLEIQYGDSDDEQQAFSKLYGYMSGYCAGSLTEVVIDGLSTSDFMFDFGGSSSVSEKPFSKVEKLSFKFANFNGYIPNINKYFPNVRELEFNECVISNVCHAPHLPKLERMTVINSSESVIESESLISFIRCNRQIKNLRVHFGVVQTVVKAIGEYLEQLESLDITVDPQWTDQTWAEGIDFKNVRTLTLGNGTIAMPNIFFDRLEELEIVVDSSIQSSGPFILDFLSKHPWLSKFTCQRLNRGLTTTTFCNQDIINSQFALQIATALPLVVQLDLSAIYFSVQQAIDLMKQCALLKVFSFTLKGKGKYKELKMRSDKEWTPTIDNTGLVILYR